MRSIVLPNGKNTTQIGFGCSGLNGGWDTSHSRDLVAAAYEAGIRYFDVAPSYGNGSAESILGMELADKMNEVTVCTKTGIEPPKNRAAVSVLRGLLKPILGKSLGKLRAATAPAVAAVRNGKFDLASIEASVERSRRQLKVGSIDGLLLHEVRLDDLTAATVERLMRYRNEGDIGMIGLGTSRQDAETIAKEWPELVDLTQFSWSIGEPEISGDNQKFVVTHRAIRNGVDSIEHLFKAKPGLQRKWSAELDADLSSSSTLAELLLAAALENNPHGLILASTQKIKRIQRFVDVAGDKLCLARGRRLQELWHKQATLDISGSKAE